jgi:lactate dehydrogenase-like 2-hydroxyacid dehydrogenase
MGRIGKEMASRPEVSICAILYYNRSRQEDIEKELGAEIHLFDPIC